MNTRKGFTLVELLVVIAILAILATVSVVGYTSFIKSADESAMQQETHQVTTIINHALILDDSVAITLEEDTVVLLEKDADGNVVASEVEKVPAEVVDLAEDIGAELIDKLSFDNGLVYTYDADTNSTLYEAKEEAPAESEGEGESKGEGV